MDISVSRPRAIASSVALKRASRGMIHENSSKFSGCTSSASKGKRNSSIDREICIWRDLGPSSIANLFSYSSHLSLKIVFSVSSMLSSVSIFLIYRINCFSVCSIMVVNSCCCCFILLWRK